MNGLQGPAGDAVVDAVRSAISPISDVRCTKAYREHMVRSSSGSCGR
jgi:CO/xanthine dehydrogenase FAD-binding subunit